MFKYYTGDAPTAPALLLPCRSRAAQNDLVVAGRSRHVSPPVRAFIIASAAAAVGVATLLGTRAAWYPTLVAAVLTALLSSRAPAIVPPVIISCFYVMPVASFGLTGRWHFSALTPVLALLLASLAVAIPRTATLPNPWRAALACWALVVAVSWPIIALREIDFWWPLLWSFRIPTAAGGFPPPAVVGWTAHVAASQLLGLLWFEYLWALHPGAGAAFIRRVVVTLGAVALGASLLAVYQGFVDLEFLSSSVWPSLRRAAGALMDANASGMLAAMWLTGFMALAASAPSGVVRGVSVFGAAAAALATWCSGSRSALAAATIGVGVMLIGSLGSVRRPRRMLSAGVAAFAVAALVLMLVVGGLLPPQSTSPLARIVASVPGGPTEIARWLWTREGYGTAAVQMIRDFPVAGVGIGTFHSIGVDYSRTVGGVALPPDNAQNWYRHQMAELGTLGSLGWLAFIGLFTIAVIRPGSSVAAPMPANALRGSLAALAFASLVGMPGQHPAIILTFWTFAFWLLQLIDPAMVVRGLSLVRIPTTLKGRTTSLLVVAIVGVHAAATVYSSRHDLRVPYRAARFDFDYEYGFIRQEGSDELWVRDHAVAVPRAATNALQLTLRSDAASDRSPVGTVIRIDGTRVVRRTLRGSESVTEVVSVPGGGRRFVLEVHVTPASDAEPRPRVAVRWEFVR